MYLNICRLKIVFDAFYLTKQCRFPVEKELLALKMQGKDGILDYEDSEGTPFSNLFVCLILISSFVDSFLPIFFNFVYCR